MNISTIAALAGVSPATVSRYLNHGYVSEEKRKKIQEVIRQTGYTPSSSAQTLRTGRNNLIGVIVPKISSESVARMVDGITEAVSHSSYQVLLANTGNNTERELEYLKLFRVNNVDGVIFIGTLMSKKHLAVMRSYKKPIVLLGQQPLFRRLWCRSAGDRVPHSLRMPAHRPHWRDAAGQGCRQKPAQRLSGHPAKPQASHGGCADRRVRILGNRRHAGHGAAAGAWGEI